MKSASGTAQSFFLFTAPIVTGLVVVTLPAQAATLAGSSGNIKFDNFSSLPFSINTSTDTDTLTISGDGAVTAISDATASFKPDLTSASSMFLNLTSGTGRSYLGSAKSQTAIFGSFLVGATQSFSFNFSGNLGLVTAIDNLQRERASAKASIGFALFDIANIDNPLAFFNLAGGLNTRRGDFLNGPEFRNLTLNSSDLTTNFSGLEESATASFAGSFSRKFDQETVLALVEVTKSKATVKEIPEPSAIGGFATVALLLVARRWRSKQKIADTHSHLN